MKRMIVFLVALLLCGCAAQGENEDRAARLQERYADMTGCTASVEIGIERGEVRDLYLLDIERGGAETRVTVREPEELAGIVAHVDDGDLLRLEYDGMVLDAGSLDPNVNAVNAVGILLHAASEGCVTERSVESCDGCQNALRLCFETEQGSETLLVTAYFDAADTPLYAELERDGRVLAYLRFTDFAFCDILTD